MLVAEALSRASIAGSWTLQPLAVAASGGALAWYLRSLRSLERNGEPRWRPARTGSFVAGLLLLLLICCGPAQVYGRSIYWVWVSQSLALLLVVPLPLMCGQPIELSRAAAGRGLLARLVDSRAGRALSSPLVGPALIPIVCVLTLFGPVPGWVAGAAPIGWLVQLVLVLVGAAIVLPLVAPDDQAGSVAVGAAVAVGFVELLVDAIPGIVLRLSTRPVSGFFSHRGAAGLAPPWLHDQQIGGGVLWCVAELLDLPFLALVFRRWVRADAREAAAVDAALDQAALDDASRRHAIRDRGTAGPAVPQRGEADLAGTTVPHPGSDPDAMPEPEQPWFLSDPQLRQRLRRES